MNKQTISETTTGIPIQIVELLEGWLRGIVREELQNHPGSTDETPTAKDKSKLAYTYKQAAEILSISVRTLENLVRHQTIEFCRIGTSVRFTREQLEEYLQRVTIARPKRTPRSS